MKPTVAARLVRTFLTAAFAGCLLLCPVAAWAVCGDGNLEQTEECDDANSVDDDCCSNDCKAAQVESFCTDGNPCTFDFCDGFGFCTSFPNQQAECDDGNACTVGDFCNSDGFCTNDGTLEDGSFCGDESLCGGGGRCFNGFCFGDPADCQGYGVCNSAVCNQETGSCDVTQLEDDTPCDNPHPCTDPGVCKSGECEQPPTDCSDFADACNDALCDVEVGGCFSVWKENGTACDDTNGCTDAGTCDDGVCLTTPKDCSSFADQCNDAACDPKSEEGCFALPKDDGTGCDDDLACTTSDVCTEGACGGTPVDCSEAGDACNIPFCNPQTGECDTTPVEVPTDCDDGNPCTTGEQCRGSFCGGGEDTDCSNFDTACTTGVCNVQTGECEAVPNQDGGECDDGDKCTFSDQCVEGVCAGTLIDCSESSDQCNVGFCNGDTGGCESDPVEEPTSCNDGSPCTVNDACSNGECVGTPKDCSQFDTACTTGGCSRSGNCFPVPNEDGEPCDDGDKCTTGDQCVEGQCQGTPVDCSSSSDQCNTGVCNGDTGGCVAVPVEEPAECNDGDVCTSGDACSDGECVGTPADCSDLDGECVEGRCDTESGNCEAVPVEEGSSCDDGNKCTTADECSGRQCVGTPKDCSASGGNCIIGECNPDTGLCVGEPAEDGTTCSDGDLCTREDQCTDGQCVGDPVTCKPSTAACRESFCNGGSGACDERSADNGTACTDGNLCTTTDVCTDGTCAGSATDCSNLDDDCNTGSCNSGTGACVAVPRENGTGCSDSNPCTVGDACTAGSCTSGAAKDCSSLDAPCRSGVCNAQSGNCEAVNDANSSPCNDGAFCTATDTCTDGVCIGTGDACPGALACNGQCNEVADTCNAPLGTACESDGNPCTDDVCDGVGNCGSQANEAACDDGLFCTTGDRCADGACVGEPTCPQTSACGDTCDEANDACRTCGKPFSNSRCIVNAIFVLQGALGLRECELCTCDVDSSGDVMATDALMILRTCTNLPVPLDCPPGGSTTTTTTTTTTVQAGCEASLHEMVFNQKFTCAQSNEGGDPFCADQNEQDTIRFIHLGGGVYEVRDVPDSGFVLNGLYDCSMFTWSGGSPGEYSEGGFWDFSEDETSFSGSSAYVAVDQSYVGGCNSTGAQSPSIPPDPEPVAPCE